MATERGMLTRQEYECEAKVSSRTAKRVLLELVQSGRPRARGAGKRTAYVPADGAP